MVQMARVVELSYLLVSENFTMNTSNLAFHEPLNEAPCCPLSVTRQLAVTLDTRFKSWLVEKLDDNLAWSSFPLTLL